VLHDGQHFVGHVHDDGVGVTVGQQPGEGAAARHAEATRVVDDEQVDAAGFSRFGGDAGSGAATDDGLARGHLGAEAVEDFLT